MSQEKKWILGIGFLILIIALLFLTKTKEQNKIQTIEPTADVLADPPITTEAISTEAHTPAHSSPESVHIPAENAVPPEVLQARQEAKGTLSSAYTALKAFQAEYGRYSTDFYALGYEPMQIQQKGVVNFKVGFAKAFYSEELIENEEILENPESMSSDTYMRTPINITSPEREVASYSEPVKKISLDDYQKYCSMGCTATNDSFEIILVRPLEGHGNDVWIINDKKEIRLVCDGLKQDC